MSEELGSNAWYADVGNTVIRFTQRTQQNAAQIGQRDGLSEGDKAAVASMYGAPINLKKLTDDPPHHKKVVDDHRQIPVPGLPGPGPVSPGVRPFLLATPHHAAAPGKWSPPRWVGGRRAGEARRPAGSRQPERLR